MLLIEPVLTLWNKTADHAIRLPEDLESVMEGMGFRSEIIPPPPPEHLYFGSIKHPAYPREGTQWLHFLYKAAETNNDCCLHSPRVPFPVIEGAHPLVYLWFLNDLQHWVPGQEKIGIRVVPLKNDVKNATLMSETIPGWNGFFPTTWKQDTPIIYRINTLDDVTLKRPYGQMSEEYELEAVGSCMDRINRKYVELARISHKAEERLLEITDSHLRDQRVVTLWDNFLKEPIVDQSCLASWLAEKRFEISDASNCPWKYYKYTGEVWGRPNVHFSHLSGNSGLPASDICGCHPLVYFSFLKGLEDYVGPEARRRFDVRLMYITPSLVKTYGDHGFISTVWRGINIKYARTTLQQVYPLHSLKNVLDYMEQRKVSDSDRSRYSSEMEKIKEEHKAVMYL